MSNKDPRVDEYIAKSAEFARPILKHLRALVHQECPEAEEAIKWRMPAFLFKKRILCMIAGFNQHATLHFWNHKLVLGKGAQRGALGEFGKITSLQDLPADTILLGYVRKAIELNGAGEKTPSRPRPKPSKKHKLTIPHYFSTALKKNKEVQKNFEKLSYSHQKEYIDWLTEAKREETRRKRLETALAWIAEGKPRNWKYLGC